MRNPLLDRPGDLDVPVGDALLGLLRDVLPLDVHLGLVARLALVGNLPSLRHLAELHLLRLDRGEELEVGTTAAHAAAAFSTSWTVTRPSAPEPSTLSMSTPCSSALRSAAAVALCFAARRWRRFSPSSIALWVAASPRSFASSLAAEPSSLATTLAIAFASWPPEIPSPPLPPPPLPPPLPPPPPPE